MPLTEIPDVKLGSGYDIRRPPSKSRYLREWRSRVRRHHINPDDLLRLIQQTQAARPALNSKTYSRSAAG